MSYEYHYAHREANFGPPIESEVRGGAHLTFDVICRFQDQLVAFRRPNGLHDGPKNALYFPHGLIRFGETVDDCVQRLLDEQGGRAVALRTDLYTMPSWVEAEHWHMCLNVVATLEDPPAEQSDGVSEMVLVGRGHPSPDFAWWTDEQLAGLLRFIVRLNNNRD